MELITMPTMATYKGVLPSRVGLLCVLSMSFSYSLYGHIIDVMVVVGYLAPPLTVIDYLVTTPLTNALVNLSTLD